MPEAPNQSVSGSAWNSATNRPEGERRRKSVGEAVRVAGLVLNARVRLRKCDQVGPLTRLWGKPFILNEGSITIGDRTVMHSHLAPIDLQAVNGGSIHIGDWCLVNYGTIISASEKVSIGDHCLIGHGVILMDSSQHDDHRPAKSGPVIVESHAWLGDRVIVLPAVTIGEGSVVGAGSVVVKDVPPYCLAAGNPARVVKELRPVGETATA